MLKSVIIIIFYFNTFFVFCQPKNFVGGMFLNFNEIYLVGGNDTYWQETNGYISGAIGLSTGLSVNRYLNNNYFFNFEIRYVQKGSIYEYHIHDTTRFLEVLRLNYIEVPISIGYKWNIHKRDIFIESGFAYAKLFSSEKKIIEYAMLTNISNAEHFKKTDITWFTCVKYPINIKKKNIFLGLRFSYSLFTIHEHDNLNNMVYGLQIDYKFKDK